MYIFIIQEFKRYLLFKPSHTLLVLVSTFRSKQLQEETEYFGLLPRPEIGLAFIW